MSKRERARGGPRGITLFVTGAAGAFGLGAAVVKVRGLRPVGRYAVDQLSYVLPRRPLKAHDLVPRLVQESLVTLPSRRAGTQVPSYIRFHVHPRDLEGYTGGSAALPQEVLDELRLLAAGKGWTLDNDTRLVVDADETRPVHRPKAVSD